MTKKVEYSNNGLGLGTVLFIVFLILKLVGVIAWSWWWVTAPLWIPLVLIAAIMAVCLVFAGITKIL